MKKICIDRQPYFEGEYIFEKSTITLRPGVTVLVGCNGCGKSSLLKQIKGYLNKEEIPFFSWDDRKQSNQFIEDYFNSGNIHDTVNLFVHKSEGEKIKGTLLVLTKEIGYLILNKHKDSKEFWMLLDSIDSGFSIDNVNDLKEHLFKTILENNTDDMNIYILITANAYALVKNEQCFDVVSGKYITFNSYEEYEEFILYSRHKKDKRVDTLTKLLEKQKKERGFCVKRRGITRDGKK